MNLYQVIRAILPPWQHNVQHPLVQYASRRYGRVGKQSWVLLLMGILVAIGLILWSISVLIDDSPYNHVLPREILSTLVSTFLIAMIFIMLVWRWVLLLSIISISAKMIAERRRRGDWELIYITPMKKSKWLRLQATSLGWLSYPLLKRMVLLQCGIVFIIGGFVVEAQYSQWNSGSYNYMQPITYTLSLLPFALLMIVEPIISTALIILGSLSGSANTKGAVSAIARSLSNWTLARFGITLSVTFGVLFFAIFFSAIDFRGSVFGETGGFAPAVDELVFILPLLALYSLAASLFMEWLPLSIPLILTDTADNNEFLYLWLVFALSATLGGIIVPWLQTRLFWRGAVRSLLRRPK